MLAAADITPRTESYSVFPGTLGPASWRGRPRGRREGGLGALGTGAEGLDPGSTEDEKL